MLQTTPEVPVGSPSEELQGASFTNSGLAGWGLLGGTTVARVRQARGADKSLSSFGRAVVLFYRATGVVVGLLVILTGVSEVVVGDPALGAAIAILGLSVGLVPLLGDRVTRRSAFLLGVTGLLCLGTTTALGFVDTIPAAVVLAPVVAWSTLAVVCVVRDRSNQTTGLTH